MASEISPSADDYTKRIISLCREQSEKLFSEDSFSTMVSIEDQNAELEALQKNLSAERFFFICDIRDMSLKHIQGVQECLGYSSKEFTLEMFLGLVHPSQVLIRNMMASSLIDIFLGGKVRVRFMVHFLVSNVALRHAQGHYLLFRRCAYPFQYTNKFQMLEYLAEFTLVGKFQGTSYQFRYTGNEGKALQQDLLNSLQDRFEKLGVFSVQEWRILRRFASEKDLTNLKMGTTLKIKEATLKVYNSRIVQKGRRVFGIDFLSAREVAFFLREQGFVPV